HLPRAERAVHLGRGTRRDSRDRTGADRRSEGAGRPVTRLLPAHVLAASAAAGLALANLVRLNPVVALLLAGALGLALAAAQAPTLAAAGAAVLVVAVGWGSWRLDALDRSALQGEIGRAGRFVAVITG